MTKYILNAFQKGNRTFFLPWISHLSVLIALSNLAEISTYFPYAAVVIKHSADITFRQRLTIAQ